MSVMFNVESPESKMRRLEARISELEEENLQ
jgi:hypothetical protein